MITLLYITAFLNFVLGVFSYANNRRYKQNLYFFFLTIFISLWAISNAQFQVSTSSDEMFFWAILAYEIVALLIISFWLFVYSIYDSSKNLKRKTIIIFTLTFSIGLIGPLVPNFLTEGVNFLEREINTTPWISLFFFNIIVVLVDGLQNLWIGIHNESGIRKIQIQFIFLGVLGTILTSVSTNLILPAFGIYSAVTLGPIFSVFLLSFISYSIARHNLFDIRLFFGRVVYYIILATVSYLSFYAFVFIDISLFEELFSVPSLVAGVFFALLFVIGYEAFYKYISNKVESNIINPGYDRKEVIAKLNSKFSLLLPHDEIENTLIKTVKRTVRPYEFFIIIERGGEYYLPVRYSTLQAKERTLEELKEIFFLEKMNYSSTFNIDFVDSQDYNLDKDITNFLQKNSLKLLLAFSSKQDKLRGVALLGKREGHLPYTKAEEEFLRNAIDQFKAAYIRYLLYEQVQSFNQTLQQKVEEATEELKLKNISLATALRKEQDMMDILGHELRTPLGTARNAVVMMKPALDRGDTKKVEKYIEMAKENIRREASLVQTILQSARLENNRLQFVHENVELIDVIDDAIVAHGKLAESKELTIEKESHVGEKIYVRSDRTAIQQIVDNLVSNAVKYTQQGGVRIVIKNEGTDRIRVSVIDTGEGISEEDLKNIGKKFFRANPYVSSQGRIAGKEIVRPGGTGIGVYVVKGLLHAMDSELEVESELGKGSTFSFTLRKSSEKDLNPAAKNNHNSETKQPLTRPKLFVNSLGEPINEGIREQDTE